MAGKILLKRPKGFLDSFDRRPGPIKTNMHYCPGCGHGVLHKLIAEAISDFRMQDKMIVISPVGCAVFAYYYFDAGGISVPHGRAPAVATGIVRANPDSFVISYQGDGDIGAIGLNNFLQAANRGENLAVCFINNAVYGMTSGQMAPTTLIGQKTPTSPYGRSSTNEGFPLKVSEMVAALDSPIYVERVALTSPKNIRSARRALRKALTYMKEHRGFSLVEFLSACPVNLKITPREADEWIEKQMIPYYPIGVLKDIGKQRPPIVRPKGIYDKARVKQILFPDRRIQAKRKKVTIRRDLRIKCAGTGGQGILSLGLMIAQMGQSRNVNVTWLPSYGPEMRGGTANCSVVVSNDWIGTPIVRECNLLIAMNQASLDKFLPDLARNGLLIYDSTYIRPPKPRMRCGIFSVKAAQMAKDIGNIRCANSVIMGAFSAALKGLEKQNYEEVFEEAIIEKFRPMSRGEQLVNQNLQAFLSGQKAVQIETG